MFLGHAQARRSALCVESLPNAKAPTWNAALLRSSERGLTMRKRTLVAASVVTLATLVLWTPTSEAYSTFSEGKVTNPAGQQEPVGNCKTCHGHFRATNEQNSTPFLQDEYISPADGKSWSVIYQEVEATEPEEEVGLHDIHRHVILDKIGRSRCNVCHTRPPGFYPVYLSSSTTTDLEPISCVGCHGRAEDMGADNISAGLGAGLRQHHTNAGVVECKTCHADADPLNYEPVGEDVPPPYYSTPDLVFPNKPTDPCNQNGEEDYAGGPTGLDNDGDGRYDMGDRDCAWRNR